MQFFLLDRGDLKYLVIPLLCLVLFMQSKLYPGFGLNPAEEIKLVTTYCAIGFAGGLLLLLWFAGGWTQNHVALPILWGLSVLMILLLRWSVRIVAAKLGLWGEPVVGDWQRSACGSHDRLLRGAPALGIHPGAGGDRRGRESAADLPRARHRNWGAAGLECGPFFQRRHRDSPGGRAGDLRVLPIRRFQGHVPSVPSSDPGLGRGLDRRRLDAHPGLRRHHRHRGREGRSDADGRLPETHAGHRGVHHDGHCFACR